jgi:hypothetical protein
MNYSFGNMLSRGGALNPDGLALDLQFAADKTLTARKGPTPTFTRASTATFVGSNGLIQTAAINAPRFDHDPVTLASRGLLIEDSRTNFLLQSENFASPVSWGKTNSSISGTLHTAPTGALTANELVEDSLLASHACTQGGLVATIGATYTFSLFVKRKPSSNQFLLIGATGLVSASFISINLTNGVTSTGIGSPGTPTNVSSTAYQDGWYRVQFSVAATSAAVAVLDIRLSRDGTWANRAYLGDGVQSSLIWGAQLELGSFPTSYIPTTTASVVRSADVCSITGSDFSGFYNQSEGTLLTNAMIANLVGENRGIAQIDNGDNLQHIRIVYGNTSGGFHNSVRANDIATQLGNNAGAANVSQKLIISYQGTSYAGTVNGAVVTTATRTQPTGLSILRIGTLAGPFYIGGHIAAIRYYKKRLPNTKLQSLTT